MDNVVYLAYKNQNLIEEFITNMACKNCRNKTFVFELDVNHSSPMVKCACCGALIGRCGWSDEE